MSDTKHFREEAADRRPSFDEPALEGDDFEHEGFDLAVERANAAVARLKDVYVQEWAPASVTEMYAALGAADLPQLYRHAHDMKGQGGTFGFPLLTELGEAICRLSAGRSDASEGEIAVLRAHVDAARLVINRRLEGEGGAAGREIMIDLRAMVRAQLH